MPGKLGGAAARAHADGMVAVAEVDKVRRPAPAGRGSVHAFCRAGLFIFMFSYIFLMGYVTFSFTWSLVAQ